MFQTSSILSLLQLRKSKHKEVKELAEVTVIDKGDKVSIQSLYYRCIFYVTIVYILFYFASGKKRQLLLFVN